jgi:hypothetical protein
MAASWNNGRLVDGIEVSLFLVEIEKWNGAFKRSGHR